MAYSLEDDVYLGLYGVWQDPDDDRRFAGWATERMRELEPLASGIQLADENLARRPAPFLRDDHRRRLAAVRRRYDPHGRFHSWLTATGDA
jgi:FAD/FMN-containing dehydrogenase